MMKVLASWFTNGPQSHGWRLCWTHNIYGCRLGLSPMTSNIESACVHDALAVGRNILKFDMR